MQLLPRQYPRVCHLYFLVPFIVQHHYTTSEPYILQDLVCDVCKKKREINAAIRQEHQRREETKALRSVQTETTYDKEQEEKRRKMRLVGL